VKTWACKIQQKPVCEPNCAEIGVAAKRPKSGSERNAWTPSVRERALSVGMRHHLD
jgi:hypothetical protein